jgi:hypothetical protein
MSTFIVNVEQRRITPVVIEAENEWEAMRKVTDGEGYIHETGSVNIDLDSTSWQVESYQESKDNLWLDSI